MKKKLSIVVSVMLIITLAIFAPVARGQSITSGPAITAGIYDGCCTQVSGDLFYNFRQEYTVISMEDFENLHELFMQEFVRRSDHYFEEAILAFLSESGTIVHFDDDMLEHIHVYFPTCPIEIEAINASIYAANRELERISQEQLALDALYLAESFQAFLQEHGVDATVTTVPSFMTLSTTRCGRCNSSTAVFYNTHEIRHGGPDATRCEWGLRVVQASCSPCRWSTRISEAPYSHPHRWTTASSARINHGNVHPGNCQLVTTTWDRCTGCSFTRNTRTSNSTIWCHDRNAQPMSECVGVYK
jgi:hypothetical protein